MNGVTPASVPRDPAQLAQLTRGQLIRLASQIGMLTDEGQSQQFMTLGLQDMANQLCHGLLAVDAANGGAQQQAQPPAAAPQGAPPAQVQPPPMPQQAAVPQMAPPVAPAMQQAPPPVSMPLTAPVTPPPVAAPPQQHMAPPPAVAPPAAPVSVSTRQPQTASDPNNAGMHEPLSKLLQQLSAGMQLIGQGIDAGNTDLRSVVVLQKCILRTLLALGDAQGIEPKDLAVMSRLYSEADLQAYVKVLGGEGKAQQS